MDKKIILLVLIILIFLLYSKRMYIFNELIYSDINFKPSIGQNDKFGIIGGGLCGLSIAYYLVNNNNINNSNIMLFESKDKVCGNIQNYEENCPAMMSCFDYKRYKHLPLLMNDLNLKPTKVNSYNTVFFYNGKRFLLKNNILKNNINLNKIFYLISNYSKLYELVRAQSSINYFTSNDKFTLSQLFCYIRKNYKYSYYTIENGNVSKIINKLYSNVNNKIIIKKNYQLKNIKVNKYNKIVCTFLNNIKYNFDKIVLTIPPHYLKNIINPNTQNKELALIYKLSKCCYRQKSYSMFHTFEKIAKRNSALTYQKVKYLGRYHYILHINPRLFYKVNTIPSNRRISIWYEYEDLCNIDKSYILDKRYSEITLIQNGKEQRFKKLLKKIQKNNYIYLASSYLSYTKWCGDAVHLASYFKNI